MADRPIRFDDYHYYYFHYYFQFSSNCGLFLEEYYRLGRRSFTEEPLGIADARFFNRLDALIPVTLTNNRT